MSRGFDAAAQLVMNLFDEFYRRKARVNNVNKKAFVFAAHLFEDAADKSFSRSRLAGDEHPHLFLLDGITHPRQDLFMLIGIIKKIRVADVFKRRSF